MKEISDLRKECIMSAGHHTGSHNVVFSRQEPEEFPVKSKTIQPSIVERFGDAPCAGGKNLFALKRDRLMVERASAKSSELRQ